ncbi:MAG: lipoprotein insertase outer membrane protein LolB [Woeseiaceae bacterium]|nr:lipoprotein insertase outer membrane protein LolB [Woeseiaceae bacterium]
MATALAAGCATRQSALLPELSDWETRQAVLAHADDWEIAGRIGVRTADDGFNGKLRWRQDGDRFTATVGGPLGIGTVRIAGDGDEVVLTDNDGEQTRLGDVEQDLYFRYGWTIPVASLRYWALGIPDPARPAETEFNAAGQLASLAQGGWDVTITHYREGAGAELPFRLSAVNGDTRVRIVIDDWFFYD